MDEKVKIINRRTGEERYVTREEALRMGAKEKTFKNTKEKHKKLLEETIPYSTAGLALGSLQGIGDLGASIGNAALMPFTEERIPHPNLGKHVPDDYQGYFDFGQMLAPGLGGIKGVQALNKIRKIPYIPKSVQNAALSGGLGWLGGEFEDKGNRALGATLGGALPLGIGTAKYLKGIPGKFSESIEDISRKPNFLQTLSEERIGQNIIRDLERNKQKGSKMFEDVLNKAEEIGARGEKLFHEPEVEGFTKLLKRVGDNELSEMFKKYSANGNVREGHKLQSKIGEAIRNLKYASEKRGLRSFEEKALREVLPDLRSRIKESIDVGLSRHGDLAPRYVESSENWRRNVIPYMKNESIRRSALPASHEDYLNSERLVNELYGKRGDPFMAQMGSRYPELKLRHLIKDINPFFKAGSVPAAAASVAYKYRD